jgi:hypothetical protein
MGKNTQGKPANEWQDKEDKNDLKRLCEVNDKEDERNASKKASH